MNLHAGGEGPRPARDSTFDGSRAGMSCWLCGQPIIDPPQIIGHWYATQARVAHRHCLQILGEHELELRLLPDPGEHT